MVQTPVKAGGPVQWTEAALPTLWAALVEDCNAAIAIVDADGHFLFANDVLTNIISPEKGTIVGFRYHDFFSHDFADERVRFIRQALEFGRGITIEGICRGRFRRTMVRPIPPDANGKRRVLKVSRPASAMDATASGAGRPINDLAIRTRYDDMGPLASLTSRELDIIRLIGAGLSTAEIAKRLHRSVKTIEWHRVSLGNKLGVANRVELARIAIGAGLVSLDDTVKEPDAEPAGA
jgi:DNA-binding CsgD family transcriptional regulator